MSTVTPASLLHWPRTLFARLALILVVGLALAQTFSFLLTMRERDDSMTHMMVGYVEREVASSVALLDHLPPDERAAWLPRLARRSYTFILGPGETGAPLDAALSERFARSIGEGIGKRYPLTVNAVPGDKERFQVHLRLSDGSPLTIDMRPMVGTPLSGWLPLVLVLQLIVLGGCCWLAVRLATGPLKRLANAADTLGPDLKAERLPESGPEEVARAAKAFNAMQDRVSTYMTQRMQILAAITHDLQTPITRMRLRVDVMDDEAAGAKLQQDLKEMESLVKEGVTYARTLHGTNEAPRRIDPDSLFESIVDDYLDAGQSVTLRGNISGALMAPPQALKRVVGNLVDNAIKYSGAAEIEVATRDDGRAVIAVLDRGPGIPDESLEAVFEPFVRLEGSRNRQTGGTGLGLAIARQLTLAMDASLTLHHREGGGLEARLVLKKAT
ncbi:HAMP domain-containing sensor histidine kinase [Caballeronia sp. LZ029]|uniref:HAMP domain-containing sensor histidine kinase n=1 Tax=Caballeronia sp. LZ029 TaxID=3038564 RepID=UPI000459D539|nr:HAMP domain-containing sensor histidine kinase [Caballeronia sp. LZ029]KAK48308.1 ATPase [Caballeronia jiangsuensis]MDR5746420.1 HAMP domain-containing sensor histidine kinase [Caballeronia sp. LZ029]